ncbi:MAG TPA: acetyl-CoA carboxylase biotin carboxyl carrier protein [Candidatus Dormibacteraeota bacterium]|nr:acetyl-CoA carboxylase biotin carboxyl carrier protein [Candidatus Dormibacteraeota bacterium]
MAGKKKQTVPVPSEVDWGEIERVLKLMDKHGLEEFEYSNDALHVRLKKMPVHPAVARAEAAPAATAEIAAPARVTAAEADGEKLHVVKSPIVGTFYSAPKPGAPAFVQVGDRVGEGQVLCIIEAMKLMNEIESDLAGEIARVFVENGQPVEYGESLFAMRPAGPVPAA